MAKFLLVFLIHGSPQDICAFSEYCGQTVEDLTDLGVREGRATETTSHWTSEEMNQVNQLVDTPATCMPLGGRAPQDQRKPEPIVGFV